jgi:hypothetical protein
MGFVLEPERAQRLIEKDARNKDVLFPYLNGEDLNTRPDQSASRWVISFFNWPIEKAKDYPDCFHFVEEKVKPERLALRDTADGKRLKKLWWLFCRSRPELYAAISHMERVLVTARVSAHHSMSFVPSEQVFADRLVVISFGSWGHFLCLSSTLHDAWAHRPGSTTHETRNTYFNDLAFDTFPFPKNMMGLDVIGERYHNHRRQIMLARQDGLTKTYNRFHDSDETDSDIQKLRKLHVEIDKAVAAAYGWRDLDFGHDHYPTKQGVRFTISEAARREVLGRLLKLNHERYAEEVANGLHKKMKGKPSRKSISRANSEEGTCLYSYGTNENA